MMLEFEPEPMAKLKERYPLAIKDIYDVLAVHFNNMQRPGEKREHVFDFQDGMRLIVSKDKMPGKAPYVHFSASIIPGTSLEEHIVVFVQGKGLEFSMNVFKEMAELRFADLGDIGDKQKIIFLGFSEQKGAPHFMMELK
jgi:hypothetical protein